MTFGPEAFRKFSISPIKNGSSASTTGGKAPVSGEPIYSVGVLKANKQLVLIVEQVQMRMKPNLDEMAIQLRIKNRRAKK